MGVNIFPKGICPKVNAIARLESELIYYNSTVQHFNPCWGAPPLSPETQSLSSTADLIFMACQSKVMELHSLYVPIFVSSCSRSQLPVTLNLEKQPKTKKQKKTPTKQKQNKQKKKQANL